jgi:ABC-type branched-subunit amino acid transport system permease subunit|tara:strand:+ start:274 stop:510 length:237 start_codon:yes stop_codon:yes gene_type:complete
MSAIPVMNPETIQTLQIILVGILVFGAVGYVAVGAITYGFDSSEGTELWNELKLIVLAGALAAFAMLGLGRRVSAKQE